MSVLMIFSLVRRPHRPVRVALRVPTRGRPDRHRPEQGPCSILGHSFDWLFQSYGRRGGQDVRMYLDARHRERTIPSGPVGRRALGQIAALGGGEHGTPPTIRSRRSGHPSVRRRCAATGRWDVRPATLVARWASRCLSACRCTVVASRRAVLRLLAPVHGQVHQRVAVVHRLHAAAGGPVGLETRSLPRK